MVTYETQCYENDYEYILTGDRLERAIKNCNYNFEKRIVLVNKVFNKRKVAQLCEKNIARGVIDEYHFSNDYIKEALKFFSIKESSFKGGLNFSRAQLVGLYLCKTEYLLHFTTDSYIEKNNSSQWISEAIKLMETESKYVCANPCWNEKYEGAKAESLTEIRDWYIGYGFSDNCYLVPTHVFKNKIYNEYNQASDRYPGYAGECFEKRVDSYMRNHGLLRLTNKHISFTTNNFPKKTSIKIMNFFEKHSVRKIRNGIKVVKSIYKKNAEA
ncbi:MAG: hypothetical protein WCV85_03575 [Patescibacteria group bacterium]|jgi:hypothetical protein